MGCQWPLSHSLLTPVTGPGELEGMRGTKARGIAGPRVSGLPLLPSGHVVGYSEAERAHRGGGHGHHQKGAVGKCPGGHLPGVRVYFGECPFLLLPWLPLLGQPEPRAGQGCRTRCLWTPGCCLPWARLQGASSEVAFAATFQKGAAELLEEGDHSNAQEITSSQDTCPGPSSGGPLSLCLAWDPGLVPSFPVGKEEVSEKEMRSVETGRKTTARA